MLPAHSSCPLAWALGIHACCVPACVVVCMYVYMYACMYVRMYSSWYTCLLHACICCDRASCHVAIHNGGITWSNQLCTRTTENKSTDLVQHTLRNVHPDLVRRYVAQSYPHKTRPTAEVQHPVIELLEKYSLESWKINECFSMLHAATSCRISRVLLPSISQIGAYSTFVILVACTVKIWFYGCLLSMAQCVAESYLVLSSHVLEPLYTYVCVCL